MNALSGRIDGSQHLFPVRVYYEDTDAAGIVYHSIYLNYAERARTELLRLLGFGQAQMRAEQGCGFVVRSCSLEFLQPARFDDLLEVRTRLTRLAGASLSAEQLIYRGKELLVQVVLKLAFLGADGRPTRFPAPLRAALEPFSQRQDQR